MSTTTIVATPVTGAQNLALLIGRLLIASLYLPAGIHKAMGFAGTVGYIGSVGMPVPQLAAVVAILVEIGCSVALILGWRTRWAAIVLALFTVAASFYFHAFWTIGDAQKVMLQQTQFFKNMAIAGGLLAFWAWGAGAFALDSRRVV